MRQPDEPVFPADLPRARPIRTDHFDGWGESPSSSEKSLGMLAHLLTLFTWVVGPAILLLTQAEKSPFVARHARESLNFQVTVILHSMALVVVGFCGGLVGYLVAGTFSAMLAGYMIAAFPVTLVYLIWEIYVIVKASIAASRGHEFRYPFTVRLF